MGLKSRQAAVPAKTSGKNNIAKNSKLGVMEPTGGPERVSIPRVPVNSEEPSLTPYQRMKQLLAARAAAPNTITAVEDLKQFLLNRPNRDDKVTIRMKLLWISDHTYQQWRLVRLHLVDADSPESLDDMLSVFYGSYDANHQDIDSVLLTVTVWNMESGSELLPPPGAVVAISNYSHLQLYQDSQCQLTARMSQQ